MLFRSHSISPTFSCRGASFSSIAGCCGSIGFFPSTTGDSSVIKATGGAEGISSLTGAGVDITISGECPDVPKEGVRTTGGNSTEDAGTSSVGT
jgi:hypothetical protein